MIYTLIYISKAAQLMSTDALLKILNISRQWNEEHQITGMLLYVRGKLLNHAHGRFIQALEGDKADIMEIFEKIKRDDRHYNVTLLNQFYIPDRVFKNWAMGFESVEDINFSTLPGSFQLNDEFLSRDPSAIYKQALDMMKSFYGLNRHYGK